ncbi:unnamed protein product [Cuscuta campestris]|uniref:Uncharacterized protein n=1 Tax=Cuscuta campestris TaxID=132261 RepID=A0A484LPA3_9ASTE|nr:unnamed protein product [Cuscuta campestris]
MDAMEELKELVECFRVLSPELISWTLANRIDIWEQNPRMKLSERARKILRKIFAVGYQSICAYGGSYHSLGDFKIDNDGAAFFLENKFIQEASGEDVQAL